MIMLNYTYVKIEKPCISMFGVIHATNLIGHTKNYMENTYAN